MPLNRHYYLSAMLAIINPGYIKGEIKVPASKSMMQRVCAAALLHQGKTIIHNPGVSEDDKAALNIITTLGASISFHDDYIEVISHGLNPVHNIIDCGESGLAARLFIPIAALSNEPLTITGRGSLLNRSMQIYSDVLPQLGITIEHHNGKLPFIAKGPLHVKDILLDGSESSQFLSGLLFAYAFTAKEKTTITVKNLKSKPYIDLTLQVLNEFGKTVRHEDYQRFIIDPFQWSQKDEVTITIEGDWSSAANWLVAGAINGDLILRGLNIHSSQADKAILTVLENAKVPVEAGDDYVKVNNMSGVSPFEFDATDCPDLFPPLAVLAACCYGESSITGVHRLMNKESNRVVSIGDMLQEFGIFFSIEDDTMVIDGLRGVEHATIDSYNDHRVVMAAAIGALRARKPVVITDAEAVNKSYPGFFNDLISAGATCILKEQ